MRKKIYLTPSLLKTLKIMGEQIRLARLRRNFSQQIIADRAGISRPTLLKIENGAPDVAIGYYISVLQGIGGLDKDFLKIAEDDVTGRTYLELGLKVHKRSPKR